MKKSLSIAISFMVALNGFNVAEAAPTAWSSPTESISIVENTTSVAYTETASAGEGTLEYSLGGGADDALFTIDTVTGTLSFTAAPDYETPNSAAESNIYTVEIDVTDGVQATPSTLTLTITVTDAVPAFTSSGTATFAENGAGTAYTSVATVGSTYSISGGVDQALFSINGATGAVTFLAVPNFEAPTDAGANNVYNIVITATIESQTATENVAITVTDVNENSSGGGGGGSPAPSAPSAPALKNQSAITLTSSVTTIEFGGSFTVSAKGGESTGGISYASSGDALCAIDASGNVSAVGKGTCTITATRAGDATYASATSNSVTVTVTDNVVPGVIPTTEPSFVPTMSIAKPVKGVTTARIKIDTIYAGDRVTVLLGKKVGNKTTYRTLGSATVSATGQVTYKSKVALSKGSILRLKLGSEVIFSRTIK